VSNEPPLLLALDLTGTFAFALNGALTAVRLIRLDVVGVLTLGIITAMGGGIIRDVMIGAVPPATFSDWRYLVVAASGALIAFFLGRRLDRMSGPINLLDAAGLSLFAVTGASKALEYGLGPVQAVILGAVTGVGGGTVRDVMIQRIPTVMRSELYAIPALAGATVAVVAIKTDLYNAGAAVLAALVCFGIRVVGMRLNLNAPGPPTGEQVHRHRSRESRWR
jgi:uncharacterized membrane protein YeiH